MSIKGVIQFVLLGGLFLFGLPVTGLSQNFYSENSVQIIDLSSSGYEHGVAISFSQNGKQVAIGGSSGVYLFNSNSLSREGFIETEHWARSVAYSPDGGTIVAGIFDGTIQSWQLPEGTSLWVIKKKHTDWVRSIAISRDGKTLVTVGDDNVLNIWNMNDGSLKLTIDNLTGPRVVALSPDAQNLAVGLQDSSILLIRVSDGTTIKTLTGHKDWVRSLGFSPNGKKLASGAFDATARIWDVESGQIDFVLSGHQSSVLGLDFSPDGTILATGSVDTTVKLWNTTDGSLMRTLVGHTDFVYDVAFSPDGNVLASTSSDNTARLWQLDQEIPAVLQPPTSSDCRDCHHPRGFNAPPRVIQVSCETCHPSGISMNWCVSFPRSSQAISNISFSFPTHSIGVPISSENIAVHINYPTNGEILYSNGINMSPVFVKGHVFCPGDKADVTVQMEIWSDRELVGELFTQPDQDGNFTFKAAINPAGATIVAGAKAADPDCSLCHEDFESQIFFPIGEVHFVITAALSDGQKATDERWVTVDTSGNALVEIQVVDEESGDPIADLPIHATTILYEWRNRYSSQISGADGIASLSLESLSQFPTSYKITIPPAMLGGYLYESVQPVFLELPAGAARHDRVTIYVKKMSGQISGKISGGKLSEALDIWAVHLPDGAYQKAAIENNAFNFDRLPGGEYRVFVDPALDRFGYKAEAIQVDLTKEAEASISIKLDKSTTSAISGIIQDEDGNFLPFGWVTSNSETTTQMNPLSGTYTLSGWDSSKTTVIADVPGYYSQAKVAPASSSQNFALVLRPDTHIQPWGNGRVILPSETDFEEDNGNITLKKGWIWGNNEVEESLNVSVAGIQITLKSGTFAVEFSPLQGGWIYLSEGEATLRTEEGYEVALGSGQMAALSESFQPIPVPYDETVFAALHPDPISPLQNTWEPSLGSRIRDWFARLGINIAQVITFVTYILVPIAIVALLIGVIYSSWKYGFKKPHN